MIIQWIRVTFNQQNILFYPRLLSSSFYLYIPIEVFVFIEIALPLGHSTFHLFIFICKHNSPYIECSLASFVSKILPWKQIEFLMTANEFPLNFLLITFGLKFYSSTIFHYYSSSLTKFYKRIVWNIPQRMLVI